MKFKSLVFLILIFASTLVHGQEDLIDDIPRTLDANESADMQKVGQALDMFYAACGRYPTSKEGLQALISKPRSLDCKKWGSKTPSGARSYLIEVPADLIKYWNYSPSADGHSYGWKPTKPASKN